MNERKLKILSISPAMLAFFLKMNEDGSTLQNASFVSAYYNHEMSCFDIVMENPEWPETQPGQLLQRIFPVLKNYYEELEAKIKKLEEELDESANERCGDLRSPR